MTPVGLPHSGIHGSKPAYDSPWHFAVNRALHRLLAPRHPPYALNSLTYVFATSRFYPKLAFRSDYFRLLLDLFLYAVFKEHHRFRPLGLCQSKILGLPVQHFCFSSQSHVSEVPFSLNPILVIR